MKKVLVVLCLVVVLLAGVFYSQSGKATDVQVNLGESVKFSDEELTNAAKAVKKKVRGFKSIELEELWYTEEESDRVVEDYLKYGKGSTNGIKEENVIVLVSNLKTDAKGGDGSFEPDFLYTDWNWILIRDDSSGKWRVDDWGY
ncbi:uncharacterized protein DUF4829 [Planomicrobium soli]|uniref:Uncharacterized protein DUF4829 n=1 Tax=Planomicrobium soli TaxID=1176648 RepID=A0A2P8H4B4_9BACL|nr:DUF4829 domain-containing protein [Planomicrobium soli]PSL41054.1 uncharacterized protein DUF4829 [Planomicrobium soli]